MKVLLLDGYNLMYRARYSGMNKGDNSTVFNFFRSLRPLIERFNPDKAFFVLEGSPKSRLALASDYKGQRVYNNKDNFREQRKQITEIIKNYFPVQAILHEDFECDDVIGFLAEKFKKDNTVTIISSDTDFIQCIDENVELYNPVRKLFLEKPDYDYITWKALKGDASDNIEGFKGIGDKKAQKLCKNKELFNDFLLNESNNKKLSHNIEMIRLHTDKIKGDDLTIYPVAKERNWDNLRIVFSELEFNSIVGNEKSWQKYINTFNTLFRGGKNEY